jgi:hypothetical protein
MLLSATIEFGKHDDSDGTCATTPTLVRGTVATTLEVAGRDEAVNNRRTNAVCIVLMK